MANLRSGTYGSYYGSFYSESEPLTDAEMKLNATYIYNALSNDGWSINAISAILGNMQAESSINPGRWQSDNVGSMSNGYGLVQWTPATNYLNYIDSFYGVDPSQMDMNLNRIRYELDNGLQWIAREGYNISFEDFSKSNESVEYLAKAFLLCYERPKDQSASVQNYRAGLAKTWYSYLNGTPVEPGEPDNPNEPNKEKKKRKKKFNFIIHTAMRRRETWIR